MKTVAKKSRIIRNVCSAGLSRRERRARAQECGVICYRITDELQRSYAYSQGIEESIPRFIGDYVTYYTLPDTDRKLAYFDAVLGCKFSNLRAESKEQLHKLHSKAYQSRRLNQERYIRYCKRKRIFKVVGYTFIVIIATTAIIKALV